MSVNLRLIQGSYLSLTAPLEWCNIPPFAVLTGPNGSGKTQLLTLISNAVTQGPNHNGMYGAVLEGLSCKPADVVLQNAEWKIPQSKPVTFQHLEQDHQRRRQIAAQRLAASQPPIRAAFATVVDHNAPEVVALAEKLPEGAQLADKKTPHLIIEELGLIFRQHHLDRLELKWAKKTDDEIVSIKGIPLWDVANDILAGSSLAYRILPPEHLNIREPYILRLISIDNNIQVAPENLSSGESALFSMLVGLFASQQFGAHPKLLLLDEPDAHLHTSQIGHLLHMLRTILVKKYGCQVIMSTHRPDTIVQVEANELFEMNKAGQPRIRPCESRASLLASVTSYIVDVLPSTRCIYVEGEQDVIFYTNIKDIILHHNLLPRNPNLVFCSASLGQGRHRIPGGCNPVISSVKKLRQAGLRMVCGIIDRDNNIVRKPPEGGIFSALRYNIENYLYDPLLIYCLLLHKNRAPLVSGIPNLMPGDEIKLMEMEQEDLQKIINTIVLMMEANISSLKSDDKVEQPAKLLHGQHLRLPRWQFDINGHHLEAPAHQLDSIINKNDLTHMLLCSRLAYQEFCDLFGQIQTV